MSNNATKLIFVTGATGFIGFQIAVQLLAAGYRIRCPARGKKIQLLQNALSGYDRTRWEVVNVPDIFSGSLSQELKGVYAIVHVAFDLRPKDVEAGYKAAVDGSLFILREAIKASITKFIGTSSTVTFQMEGPYGPDDWNTVTKDDAIQDPGLAYIALKTAADKAIISFGDPELDISLIAPDFTYGPMAPGFEELCISENGPNYDALSTSGFLYRLLKPDNQWFPQAYGVNDVRDSARAHVLAIESPPTSIVGRKRFIIVTPEDGSYRNAVNFIAEERPHLKDRLVDVERVPTWPSHTKAVDRKRIEEVIGFKQDEYTTWKKTVIDSVDSLMKLEEFWRERGFEVVVPGTHPLS